MEPFCILDRCNTKLGFLQQENDNDHRELLERENNEIEQLDHNNFKKNILFQEIIQCRSKPLQYSVIDNKI